MKWSAPCRRVDENHRNSCRFSQKAGWYYGRTDDRVDNATTRTSRNKFDGGLYRELWGRDIEKMSTTPAYSQQGNGSLGLTIARNSFLPTTWMSLEANFSADPPVRPHPRKRLGYSWACDSQSRDPSHFL